MTDPSRTMDETDEFEKCVPIILAQTEKSVINGSSNVLEIKDQSTKKNSTSGSSCLSNDSKDSNSLPSKVQPRSSKCLRSTEDISKRGIIKNVVVISVSFVLMFAAYASLSALQSSLHLQQGMGVINQAVLYAVMAVSCLVLPKIVIRVLGHKWTMAVSLAGYVAWMGANGYGVWLTMLPASIVAGMSAAVLWTTHGSYFSILAKHYALKTKQEPSAVTSLFFGVFVAFFAFAAIFGNLLSSMILRPSSTDNKTQHNEDTGGLGDVCGLNDCPGVSSNRTHLAKPPPPDLVWTLVGVDIAMGTASVIIFCIFVDPLPSSWVPEFDSSGKNLRKVMSSSLLATAKHMFRLEQLLLIPISIYMGMQYAFVDAEYTKSFISCFLAIWMVGWCLLPSAVCRGLGSLISGRMAKYTGIVPVFVYGLIVDMSYQLALLLWTPSESQLAIFILLPCLSTLADAVWQPQIKALYGVMFADDTASAFAVCTFFNACGCIVVFALSSLLCTRFKLYILSSVFAVGVTLLFVVLFASRRSRRSKSAEVQN